MRGHYCKICGEIRALAEEQYETRFSSARFEEDSIMATTRIMPLHIGKGRTEFTG